MDILMCPLEDIKLVSSLT